MSDYKSTFKNTMAFGGLQFVNIFLNLIKGKFIAMYLGPFGIGVNNLLVSTLNVITTFNDFGLDLSAVRNISEAHEADNRDEINRTVSIVERLFFYTAILGTILCAVLSPFLSQWTFGNSDYTVSFLFLSIFVFFATLNKGQQTVLRGLRHVNYIIKSGFFGSLAGVVISVPLYYFIGVKGIVPALVLTTVCSFFISKYYYSLIPKHAVPVQQKEIWREGKGMMKLGMMLVFSILMGMLVKYLIGVGIGRIGDIKDVGLYSAAISISSQYVGFILMSLGADYFPRLVAVSGDTKKMNAVVNEQTEIVLLLATPLLILMIVSAPLLIRLLLSKEFLSIVDFIRFIALGSYFQLASYCMGYISFAKNDRKTYVVMEGIIANLLNLIGSILMYYLYGLLGLSLAYLGLYILYFFIVYTVTNHLYGFKIEGKFLKFFLTTFLFIFSVFLLFLQNNPYISYGLGAVILLLNLLFSYRHLNEKMDIKNLIQSKFKKRN